MEMATLAVKCPERLDNLVFVDALYEYEESDIELFGSNPVPAATPPPESFASVADYCEDFVNRYVTYRPHAWQQVRGQHGHDSLPTPTLPDGQGVATSVRNRVGLMMRSRRHLPVARMDVMCT